MLAFARKGKFTVEDVNMHALINDVISLMQHTVDPKIALSCRLEALCATVKGDRSQLHSALLNLGVNSRDALPEGGIIDFSTDNVPGDEVQDSDAFQEPTTGQYLKIAVKDNGTGMDQATVARVFEPFFSTKEEGKGTGLGLPSVYGTVKQHSGFINLESEPGKGTVFTLFLPVVAASTPPEDIPEQPRAKPVEHSGTVLVVDDNPMLREMMVEALTCDGYSVHSCEDGNEALVWFRTHQASCDLVILDYAMPGLNGRECFLEMKEIQPSIHAIIASGYAVDGEIEKTLQAGACSFLQKPFDVDDLILLVQEVLSGTDVG